MEISNSAQVIEFVLSLLLGIGFGIFYDIVRVIRRRIPFLGSALDFILPLAIAIGMLLFALYAGGGILRIFMLAAVVLGAAMYFAMLSPLILGVLFLFADLINSIICLLLTPIKFLFDFLWNFSKKLFHLLEKYYKMILRLLTEFIGRDRIRNEAFIHLDQAGDSGVRRICYDNVADSAIQNYGGRDAKSAVAGTGRGSKRGKH